MEQLRKRKVRRAWIPSIIIVLVLAGAAGVSLAVMGQGVGQPRTAPPAVAANGYSRFDDAGQRYISDTRRVWVDLRKTPIAVGPLDLPAESSLQFGPRQGVSYYLGLYGADGPIRSDIDSVALRTEGGYLTRITVNAAPAVSFGALEGAMAQATAYGISEADIATVLDEGRVLNREGKGYSREIGPGTTLGVPVTAKVSCDTKQSCSLQYVAEIPAG